MLEVQAVTIHGVGPVDLTVRRGECVGLSGPSGSGKTLLLRAIADLEPHGGSVRLDGRDAAEFRPSDWRRTVGMLAAESFWWHDRIGDHFSHIDEAALQELGFTPAVMGWEVTRCSTGERQRLALLRLLQNRPRVLLLDEPTASLDPTGVERVENLLGRHIREREAAAVWISHDPTQLHRVSRRRLRMEGGQLAREPAA